MKRQISILACVLMLLAIVFAVASCSQPEAAHVHEYVESVSKEATCTEKGEVTLTCACGDKYTNETAAKGHNLVTIAAVEPTCTTEGKTEGVKCSDCGLVTVAQSTIAPVGHKLGAAATCTTAQTCELCDHVFVEALGHKATAATCTEPSVCKACGEEQGPALGHTATEATCTEASVCTVCDEELEPALGHKGESDCYSGYCIVCEEAWVEGNDNHTFYYECDGTCNKCYQFVNWEAGHKMVYHAPKESTCTEAGNIEYWQCELCGHCWDNEYGMFSPNPVFRFMLPLAEHEYFYECDAHCMNCYELTNENAAHSLVHVDAVPATCTTNGNVEYWQCECCGAAWNNAEATGVILTRREAIVVAFGHSYEFDCDEICKACGEITREDAEHLLDHSDAVAPTCTKNGNIEFDTCEYCLTMWNAEGVIIADPTIPANGHSYEVECDPVCLVCSYVNTEAAHKVVKVTKKAATCTADGAKVDYWYCSYCDLCWVDEACTLNTNKANVVISALGHKGYETDYKCDTCNKLVAPADGTALTIPQANALAKAAGTAYTTGKYYVTGYVKIVENTTYGNMYLVDDEGNEFYIYGLYTWGNGTSDGTRYDKMTNKPVKGDELTVYTKLGMYGSTLQGKNAWVDELVKHTTHTWADATCTAPKTCIRCEVKEGDALPHTFEDGFCVDCGAKEGTRLEWVLVTNVNDLKAGDQIVFVAKNYNYAMSTEQRSNNRGSVAITKNGNFVTINDSVQIITLESSGASSYPWNFKVGEGKYLYAASSSSNYLKTGSKGYNNATWTISIASSGSATVKANQSNRNWLRFNNGNSPKLFSCYASGQTDVAIYKLTEVN